MINSQNNLSKYAGGPDEEEEKQGDALILIETLSDRRQVISNYRLEALHRAQTMFTAETVPPALKETVLKVAQKKLKPRSGLTRSLTTSIALFIVVCMITVSIQGMFNLNLRTIATLVPISVTFLLILLQLAFGIRNRRRNEMSTRLYHMAICASVQFQDTGIIPTLLDKINHPTSIQKMEYIELLQKILPSLTKADKYRLPVETSRNLSNTLMDSSAFMAHKAILEALCVVGKVESIPVILQYGDKLEWGHRQGISDMERDTILIAEKAVKSIEESAALEAQSNLLLRASDGNPEADTLLRPIRGSAESDPDQLLRAVNNSTNSSN